MSESDGSMGVPHEAEAKPERRQQTRVRSAVRSVIPSEEWTRMLFAVTARVAFPESELRKLVIGKTKTPDRWIQAYNLCDGSRSQREVAAQAQIDEGLFSRTVSRWVEAGVLFRAGTPEVPLHLYFLVASRDLE